LSQRWTPGLEYQLQRCVLDRGAHQVGIIKLASGERTVVRDHQHPPRLLWIGMTDGPGSRR
jgi:hypothetical protein